jgi:signal peptidase I
MEENSTEKKEPVPQQTTNHQGNFIGRFFLFIWDLLKIVIIAALIVFPIRYFLFQPFIVKGESMVPNLQSGDYLIVDEISYRFNPPQRGDIIVLKYPLDTTQRFIKRIIGLPGETVEVKNGNIDIIKGGYDMTLNEKRYLPNLVSTAGDVNVTLKSGQYFVLGDNRQYSYDSRSWGILPKDDIIGRAVLRVFPLSTISYITAPTY